MSHVCVCDGVPYGWEQCNLTHFTPYGNRLTKKTDSVIENMLEGVIKDKMLHLR